MITHYHTQAMHDATKGANTHTFNENAIVYTKQRLKSQTALAYSVISINNLHFSDN